MDQGIPPLRIKSLTESKPRSSRFLIYGLAVCSVVIKFRPRNLKQRRPKPGVIADPNPNVPLTSSINQYTRSP